MYDQLRGVLAARAVTELAQTFEGWSKLSPEGKADVADCAELLIECGLRSAMGEDVTLAHAALSAAMQNWEMAGRIVLERELYRMLKDGLVVAVEGVFTVIGAGLRGMVGL